MSDDDDFDGMEDAGLHHGFGGDDITEHVTEFLEEHDWSLDNALDKAMEIALLFEDKYGDELLDIDWYDDDFWEVFRELYDA